VSGLPAEALAQAGGKGTGNTMPLGMERKKFQVFSGFVTNFSNLTGIFRNNVTNFHFCLDQHVWIFFFCTRVKKLN
jgi:hypothetical protein